MLDRQTELLDGDFVIRLTIEGTEYEDVEVKVQNPEQPLRDLVDNIVTVFELEKMDGGGQPIQYMLGQLDNDSDEVTMFDYEDEADRAMTIEDYNVQHLDRLYLTKIVIAG